MPVTFSGKISAAVPRDLHEAVAVAARTEGVTLADFVRGAVQSRLTARGVAHPSVPELRRVTIMHELAPLVPGRGRA